jgi:hypothetical protein
VHSPKWLSNNPGRAAYYSTAMDWLREYQDKGRKRGHLTPNSLGRDLQPIPFKGMKVR